MSTQAAVAAATVARDLTLNDLREALVAGWKDFRAQPQFGLFFAGIYVAAGWFLYFVLFRQGEVGWLVPAAAGFPLLAPFMVVGLYEASRRREAGLPRSWGAILGALRGHGDEQLLMMGGFVFVGFTFWVILAHTIFAIFMAESGIGSESLEIFRTPAGMAMLVVGGFVGAQMALAFYAITITSLPMLVDREVDFLGAIIVSVRAVRANRFVMVAWASILSLVMLVSLLPMFLGLLVAMPVLGHATWHLYRRVVPAGPVVVPVEHALQDGDVGQGLSQALGA
jgi:uncharacterized membrane protein